MQPELAVTTVSIAALVPYAENARTHSDDQVAQIAASIAEFGFVNPVLVDAAGVLVAGHGRVMAAKRSAWPRCWQSGWRTSPRRRRCSTAPGAETAQAGRGGAARAFRSASTTTAARMLASPTVTKAGR
jgi:hypothetical protein